MHRHNREDKINRPPYQGLAAATEKAQKASRLGSFSTESWHIWPICTFFPHCEKNYPMLFFAQSHNDTNGVIPMLGRFNEGKQRTSGPNLSWQQSIKSRKLFHRLKAVDGKCEQNALRSPTLNRSQTQIYLRDLLADHRITVFYMEC
jgi:hypothetical protein